MHGSDSRTRVNSTLPGCGYLNLGWEYTWQREDCMSGISVEPLEEAIEQVARVPRAGHPEVCHG